MANMSKKTILFNILMGVVVILTSYAHLVGPVTSAWFGVITAAITLFLNTTYTQSGKWIADGWSWSQWAISIGQLILQVGAIITSAELLPADLVNYAVIAATILIQYFGKVFIKD